MDQTVETAAPRLPHVSGRNGGQFTVELHYARTGLGRAIGQGLQQAGKDPGHLTLSDLAPADKLHVRGRQDLKLAVILAYASKPGARRRQWSGRGIALAAT